MANNASFAKPKTITGAIYVAPAGTALPTDESTTLAAAFKSVGYISDDGLTNSQSITSETVKSWGGTVVATAITEMEDDFKFKMISPRNAEALKIVYGDSNVTDSSGKLTIKKNAKEPAAHVFAIEMVIAGVATRIVIPNGKLKEMGDISYKDSEAVGFDVTIAALADSSDNTHYEYSAAVSA